MLIVNAMLTIFHHRSSSASVALQFESDCYNHMSAEWVLQILNGSVGRLTCLSHSSLVAKKHKPTKVRNPHPQEPKFV